MKIFNAYRNQNVMRLGLIVGFCFLFSLRSIAQWVEMDQGMGAISITSLCSSSTSLYACGSGGNQFFRSTDGGANWINSGGGNFAYLTIAVNNFSLWGSYNNQLYGSQNNGSSWYGVSPNGPYNGVASIPLAGIGNYMFAATTSGVGISQSGGSWSYTLNNKNVTAIVANGTNLFAGTNGDGIFLSTNYGSSWTSLNTNTNNPITALAADGNNNILASSNGSGIFLSVDNGNSWASAGLVSSTIRAIAISGRYLFAATTANIYSSIDGGTHWSNFNLSNKTINTLFINNGILFAGTTSGVFAISISSFPAISSFTPTSGQIGSTVTITGSNFSTSLANNVVSFNGVVATVKSSSANQITAIVPPGATTGPIAVTTNGSLGAATATSATNFTIPTTAITSVSPSTGIVGATITITGSNFNPTPSGNVVTFNGTAATVSATTSTSLTVIVPAGATTGTISLTAYGQTATSLANFVVAPAITSFSPVSAVYGATLTIKGTNFNTTPAENVVKFNGSVATITSATSTSLIVTVPPGATNGPITVTANGITATSATNFTILGPTITSFSPASALYGATVTVTGANFSSSLTGNVVKFNGVSATVTSSTTTSIAVTLPAGSSTGPITVTTLGKTASSGSDFVVEVIPTFQTTFPATFDDGGQLSISILPSDATQIGSYNFIYQGISSGDSTIVTNSTNNVVLTSAQLTDKIGYQYYFQAVTTWNQTIKSAKGFSLRNYPTTSVNKVIPALVFGDQPSDYQMISIPLQLNNSTVTSVFSELGSYNIKQWRLFDYSNNENQEYPAFTTVDPGKGYWLIARNKATIDPGPGVVVNVTPTNPFTINLTSGWNLIGNPYGFNISWTDVLAYNKNPTGVGNLQTFSLGTLSESDVLKPYTGAFVKVANPISIKIPVLRNTSLGGRIANEKIVAIGEGSWSLPLALSDGTLTNAIGGIGMSPTASTGLDALDNESTPMPTAIGMMRLGFQIPDKSIDLMKSIIPVAENATWNAGVMKLSEKPLTLQWPAFNLNSDKELYLIDMINKTAVNMATQNSLQLPPNTSLLSFIYGDHNYVSSVLDKDLPLIGDIYPNPTEGTMNLRVHIAANGEGAVVESVLYNLMGKESARWKSASMVSGDYTIILKADCPAGIYILRTSTGTSEIVTQKIIIK